MDGGKGTESHQHTNDTGRVHCRKLKLLWIFKNKKKQKTKGFHPSNSLLLKSVEGLEKLRSAGC